MKGYHGTSLQIIKNMLDKSGGIKVSKGRGELGKGFYIGDSPGLASSWAIAKFFENGKVLALTIIQNKYDELDKIYFNKKEVIDFNVERKKDRKLDYRIHGADVIIGPFASIPHNTQYKFETKKSEKLLNSVETEKKII